MRKVLMLLGVVLFPAFAFALNAEAQDGKDCEGNKAKFERQVNSQTKTSFIMQYILINLADGAVKSNEYTEEQFVPLAQCYETYTVKGTPLVDFVRANADVFRPAESDPASALPVYDELQNELLEFANRVEKVSKQAALNKVIAHDNDDWVVQHILGNLADPMRNMTDAQAEPKAIIYNQLKVKSLSLVGYSRQQAGRFAHISPSVTNDLNEFADRVEKLAK